MTTGAGFLASGSLVGSPGRRSKEVRDAVLRSPMESGVAESLDLL